MSVTSKGKKKFWHFLFLQFVNENLRPTLNIASPDLCSAFQKGHDGEVCGSTPPLIASDEGMGAEEVTCEKLTQSGPGLNEFIEAGE